MQGVAIESKTLFDLGPRQGRLRPGDGRAGALIRYPMKGQHRPSRECLSRQCFSMKQIIIDRKIHFAVGAETDRWARL